MKKTIVIILLLAFIFGCAIAVSVPFWEEVSYSAKCYDHLLANYTQETTVFFDSEAQLYIDTMTRYAIYGSLCLLSAIAAIAVTVVVVITNFPVFRPLLDKINAKRDARKQAKAEKAAANKQARIEQLQAELDELKKDE